MIVFRGGVALIRRKKTHTDINNNDRRKIYE